MALFDLTGKTILVTGAGKGIGCRAALDLAALGARVVGTDIDPGGLQQTLGLVTGNGGDISVLAHDVTNADDWQRVIAHIGENFGRLDVLVNNAGVILNRPFVATGFADYQRVMRINVDSVYLGCQAALALLSQSAQTTQGSSIINLSSIYGQVAGPMHAAYCASKGAVRMLSKALAVEFARMKTGIRVNTVHPGPTNTDLGRSSLTDAVTAGVIPSFETGMEMVFRQFPMGRWAETEDITGVIAFLAADASKFMTGTELTVDGGYTAI